MKKLLLLVVSAVFVLPGCVLEDLGVPLSAIETVQNLLLALGITL